MPQSDQQKAGPAIGTLHEVRATFATSEAMEEAIHRLQEAGFDRAELSVPETAETTSSGELSTPEAGARPADTEEDARQARTLGTSGAAAAASIAAAGIVIATGGAAAPAVAAAVISGGVAGGLAHTLSSSSNEIEQVDRDSQAAAGRLMLQVRAVDARRQTDAGEILRAAGGTMVEAR